MKLRKSYFLLLGLILYSALSFSQESKSSDCVLILKDAERLYEQGKLETIPAVLEDCLNNGFTKEEKIQAYRLLALTYLFDDKKEQADESMQKMLLLDPEHEINPAIDPAEFIYLYNSFRTSPIASFGLSGGINISKGRLLETYSLDNSTSNATYNSQIAFQGGINGSYFVNKNLSVNLELLFKTGKLSTINTYNLNTFDNSTDTLSNFGKLSFVEKHTWLRLPINLTYDINVTPKISVFARAGGSVGLLLSAKSTYTRNYPSGTSLAPATGPEENIIQNRNKWNYWVTGGIGLKYKIKRGSVYFDARYNYGLMNITNQNNRYNNPTLIYKYYYLDDNFIMDDISFSVGFSRFLYNPKKKDTKKEKELKGYKRNKDIEKQ